MSTVAASQDGAELEARLARVEQLTAHLLEVEGDSLWSLGRAAGCNRLVPAPAAIALMVLAGRIQWRVPARRAAARAWARAVLPPAARTDARVDRLARQHLIERKVQGEMGWRPWLNHRLQLEGMDHLAAARRGGRGVIVAVPHVGAIVTLPLALGTRLGRVYVVRPREGAVGVVQGAWGRSVKGKRQILERAGCRMVTPGGSFDLLVALLRRGGIVFMAWDLRGSRPVEVLGQRTTTTGGCGELAAAAGVEVVPGMVWRERTRARARLWPGIAADAGSDVVLGELAQRLDEALRIRLPQAQDSLARLMQQPSQEP